MVGPLSTQGLLPQLWAVTVRPLRPSPADYTHITAPIPVPAMHGTSDRQHIPLSFIFQQCP